MTEEKKHITPEFSLIPIDRFNLFNHPETILSLAARYRVDRRTMRNWIRPIEDLLIIRKGKTFTPRELRIILSFLGEYNLDAA